MTTSQPEAYHERQRAILLELVHQVSSIRAGKTFVPTDYTDPVQAQLNALTLETVLGIVGDVPEDVHRYGGEAYGRYMEREAIRKALETLLEGSDG